MGGKIFSEPKGHLPALRTPRMSEAVYTHIKNQCTRQLQPFFKGVLVPADAPEKADYGDVDFLVESPVDEFTWDAVAESLNAHRTSKCGATHSFAVPITSTSSHEGDADTSIYAQIDVHLCTPGYLQWENLLGSNGDMWQIIGRFLRPLGLTATNKGLHTRIPEIEPKDRAESMLYLTHDVKSVLDFLGLDFTQYQAGFDTLEDLYRWCISGRFFRGSSLRPNLHTSNDRQRMRKRAMFRDFNEVWMPANNHLWADEGEGEVSREDVLAEALSWFGKVEEYELKMDGWRLEQAEEKLWADIAGIVLEGPSKNVNLVIRGLKRWVDFKADGGGESVRPVIRTEAEMDADRQPRWVSQLSPTDGRKPLTQLVLLEWVREHWQRVKSLEKGRVESAKAARRLVPHS